MLADLVENDVFSQGYRGPGSRLTPRVKARSGQAVMEEVKHDGHEERQAYFSESKKGEEPSERRFSVRLVEDGILTQDDAMRSKRFERKRQRKAAGGPGGSESGKGRGFGGYARSSRENDVYFAGPADQVTAYSEEKAKERKP
jgi:hypothetical protein